MHNLLRDLIREMIDPYVTLGISPNASDVEIKHAYKTKAKLLHPDRNSDPNALKAMKDLNVARDMLNNDHQFNDDEPIAEEPYVEFEIMQSFGRKMGKKWISSNH